ncbi:MAG TPA: transcription antitermination factor NusB [bacterium]|nr:transcription antitermination factor NusB [bacterium]
MPTRRSARRVALQLLYQNDVAQCDVLETLEQVRYWPFQQINKLGDDPSMDDSPDFLSSLHLEELDTQNLDYVLEVVRGTIEHRQEIDDMLREVSQNWRLERMAVAERNILRMALYEILHRPEVPPRVAINEAIDLAKIYGDEKSGGFVNGVLDAAYLRFRSTSKSEENL